MFEKYDVSKMPRINYMISDDMFVTKKKKISDDM